MIARRSGNSGESRRTSATGGSAREFTDDSGRTLEEKLGYRFSDPALLSLALSHASVGEDSNERLEFLGDRGLGLIVAEALYSSYPAESEGGLAVRPNALARREPSPNVPQTPTLPPPLTMPT